MSTSAVLETVVEQPVRDDVYAEGTVHSHCFDSDRVVVTIGKLTFKITSAAALKLMRELKVALVQSV